MSPFSPRVRAGLLAMLAVCPLIGMTGCHQIYVDETALHDSLDPEMVPPRELEMMSLPVYRIEPPDVLQLEMLKMVPKPPYRVQAHDMLQIRAVGINPDQPIGPFDGMGRPTANRGIYLVEGDGTVSLGPAYGSIRVVGMTVDEAQESIKQLLEQMFRNPQVMVQLAQMSGLQPIAGEYLVGPDGTVNLKHYGTVHVAGKTADEATEAMEMHLSQYFDSPEIAISVLAYNSKFYYIITEGAGLGDNVVKVPVTGNETVLDAVSNIGGLSQLSSKRIWIARPAPDGFGCEQILPVEWESIVRGGATSTNYQVMPDDRIFIAEDPLLAVANFFAKLTGPMERAAGTSSMAVNVIRGWQTTGRNYNRQRR